MKPRSSKRSPFRSALSILKRLGPGLITGAADDDPSGIGTYSQAGAQFGYGLLWTMVLTVPLMAAIQEISARIGRVTGRGIAANIRMYYSAWLLWPIVLLIVFTNAITVGADLGAMGDATHALVHGPSLLYCAIFALLSLLLEVFSSYSNYSRFLKWLTLVLLFYIAVAFVAKVPWGQAMRAIVLPEFQRGGAYWATVIAVLGTTISPYLFIWQASMECEEIREVPEDQRLQRKPNQAPDQFRRIRWDTCAGVLLSNIVGLFIMLAASATLYAHGVHHIDTSAQAADALRPIAGRFAAGIFALGIVGTGLLALPTLVGSAAYAVGETMFWPVGLHRDVLKAKGFNAIMAITMALGLAMNFPIVQRYTHLSPIGALFWASVVNGVVAVPVMITVMLMHQNRKVMGVFARGYRGLKAVGWLATAAMAAAAAGLAFTWKHP